MKNNVIKAMHDNILKFVDFIKNLKEKKHETIIKEKLGDSPVPTEIPIFEKIFKRAKVIINYYKKNSNLWADIFSEMFKKGLNPKKMSEIDIVLWYLTENKELEVGKIKMNDEDKEILIKILNKTKKILKYYQKEKEELWRGIERDLYIKGLDPAKMTDIEIGLWYFDRLQKNKFYK